MSTPNTKNEKTETSAAPTEKTHPELFAAPKPIGDQHAALLKSAHDLATDVDPAWAGDYELVIGTIRIGQGENAVVYRGPQYEDYEEVVQTRGSVQTIVKKQRKLTDGAKLRLGAIDAFRFMQAGTVRRIDGKKPDSLTPEPSPEPAAAQFSERIS